jgi:DNA-binding NarL/FixJ family response regulator
VIWVPTLAEGIAAAAFNKPDVVLLDLVAAGFRRNHHGPGDAPVPDVPIIVLTGQDDHQLAEAACRPARRIIWSRASCSSTTRSGERYGTRWSASGSNRACTSSRRH